ncbi:unnamed protein product [Nyctereutes procyonoides]|uniref:(raccoon dog) hypothetical protein n=1 Tax=Nyctereutes procyonoides TaxID=34880 RepID=A0A811YDT8_NYCPR|nr:unnamed protein product [Nyctereutes procyonoides]
MLPGTFQVGPCGQGRGRALRTGFFPPFPSWLLGTGQAQMRDIHRRASLLSFWELIPMRAKPLQKKKKVDPKKRPSSKGPFEKRGSDNWRKRQPLLELPFEESEWRALLLRKWSLQAWRAQELHAEATKRDFNLLPSEREGPAPEGGYPDITKVYSQVDFKRYNCWQLPQTTRVQVCLSQNQACCE